MNIHQTHTHRRTHTLPIWWIWAGRQGIKPNRRINLNDLWKILVMTFMNTLWNIENAVMNFDVRKWGRNIKQTVLNFEQGLHVKSSELTESEGKKDWGRGEEYFFIKQLFWTWQQCWKKLSQGLSQRKENLEGENESLSTWRTNDMARN